MMHIGVVVPAIEMALVISDDAFIFSNLFICSGGKHVKHLCVLCTIVSVRYDLHQQIKYAIDKNMAWRTQPLMSNHK